MDKTGYLGKFFAEQVTSGFCFVIKANMVKKFTPMYITKFVVQNQGFSIAIEIETEREKRKGTCSNLATINTKAIFFLWSSYSRSLKSVSLPLCMWRTFWTGNKELFRFQARATLSWHPPGGGNMDEQHEKQKMVVQGIIVEDVKKSSTLRPRLQKTSSARLNCLCSPTTHDGSFRCRYHRNPGLSRSSASIGSNLSALGAWSTPNASDFTFMSSKDFSGCYCCIVLIMCAML